MASRTELVYLIENIDLYNTCVGVVYIQLHANCQAYPTCLSTQGPIRFIILLQRTNTQSYIQGIWSGPLCPMFRLYIPLRPPAHPNLVYSVPSNQKPNMADTEAQYGRYRSPIWSTQKPCRTEKWFIMILDFFCISVALQGYFIYNNCPI